MTTQQNNRPRIYDDQGDELMSSQVVSERLVLVPDKLPSRDPDRTPRIRLMWGQHMLDDLLAGRYRSLVCAVNAEDNSHGILSQLAQMLPTSQWSPQSITDHAKRFVSRDEVTVIKYDMDAVEVLALLRPAHRSHLTLEDLSLGFMIVSEMVRRKTQRLPIASVSFLGARANRLVGPTSEEPSFETVLRTMYESGFTGDVYPAPWMWESAPTPVYARYPFPESLTTMREGGF
ncbi:MAG: hypothetical protein ACODAQ_07325 [Phycisphaeraceae bacterium]